MRGFSSLWLSAFTLARALFGDFDIGAILDASHSFFNVVMFLGLPAGGKGRLPRPRTAPPSAFPDHLKAQAAPTRPGAPPRQLEGVRWLSQLASARAQHV